MFGFSSGDGGGEPTSRTELQYLRASGLAQTRLQLAVLSGSRHRALEQIDRLVAIDRHLEQLAEGGSFAEASGIGADLPEQRLAIASEKLALTSGIALPRLDPAFGAGMSSAIGPEEEVQIVEDEDLKNRAFHILMWGVGFLIVCLGVTAAVLVPL